MHVLAAAILGPHTVVSRVTYSGCSQLCVIRQIDSGGEFVNKTIQEVIATWPVLLKR